MRKRKAIVILAVLVTAVSVLPPWNAEASDDATAGITAFDGPAGRTDVNGDGWPDIVVASGAHLNPFADFNARHEIGGSVYVIPGGPTLPAARVSLTNQDTPGLLDNPEPSDTFGRVLVTGDFNGDRRADVAIGNPNESLGTGGRLPGAGAISVRYGQTTYPYLDNVTNGLGFIDQGAGIPGTVEADDLFGAALATGDFDGDGFADLAVGAPGEDVGTKVDAGGIWIIYGSATGLNTSRVLDLTQGSSGVTGDVEAGDRFGWSLSAGDINSDGKDDLAVLALGEKVKGAGADDAGAVWLFKGSDSGITTHGSSDVNVASTGTSHNLRTVTIGRFHRGQYGDVLVYADEKRSAPRMSGALVMLRGGSDGISPDRVDPALNQSSPGVGVDDPAEESDLFGAALAVGDLDGDGTDDLAVGVPGENEGQGSVDLLLGGSSGLLSSPDFQFNEGHPLVAGGPQATENFGNAVRILDVTGDARPEVLVAAPKEDFDYLFGAMFVVGVTPQGESLAVTGSTRLTKSSLGSTFYWGLAMPIAGGTLSLGPSGVQG